MARPIKDTPVLSGKDSERFLRKAKQNESKKVPKKDYNRAIKTYKKMGKVAGWLLTLCQKYNSFVFNIL